ncbi:MAG: hypothetical protein C0171_02380 [Caldisphaera sp.]|nr:MAG: hypothetical protein C0171_02380 [Caldisphaera sp.]
MLKDLKRLLIITLTTPIKPGSIHRFMSENEFELRMIEALEILDSMDNSYKKGKDLALGNINAQSLSLGHIIGETLKKSFETTNERPLVGFAASSIVLSTIEGYVDTSKEDALKNFNSLLTRIVYRSSSQDAKELVVSMEDIGLSKYLNLLENNDITIESIEYENRTLGDLFEILSKIDTGFMLNLKDYSYFLKLSKTLQGYKNMMLASLKAYLSIAGDIMKISDMGKFNIFDDSSFSKLSLLDKNYKKMRDDLNGILGGVLISLYFLNKSEIPLKLI